MNTFLHLENKSKSRNEKIIENTLARFAKVVRNETNWQTRVVFLKSLSSFGQGLAPKMLTKHKEMNGDKE